MTNFCDLIINVISIDELLKALATEMTKQLNHAIKPKSNDEGVGTIFCHFSQRRGGVRLSLSHHHLSTQYFLPNTKISLLFTQYPIPNTLYSLLNTLYSILFHVWDVLANIRQQHFSNYFFNLLKPNTNEYCDYLCEV